MAERAVRYLREHPEPIPSVEMARVVLSARVHDETMATRVLSTAFGTDDRLKYEQGAWRRVPEADRRVDARDAPFACAAGEAAASEPDRVLLAIEGGKPARGARFAISRIAAVRLQGGDVVQGCGGDLETDRVSASELREAVRDILVDAIPVVHDPPGAVSALERWLDEPIPEPLSLRRLAAARLDLPAGHDLETLAGRLGVRWTSTDDPVSATEALEACLAALRLPGESLEQMLASARGGGVRVPWERFAFDRTFLRTLPETAGTYRFLDRDGIVVYIGRSRNLRRRLASYFREGGRRNPRVERLLGALHRIEFEPLVSDLEAVLEEARQIAMRKPSGNVQLGVHADAGRHARLRSILILEPAPAPSSLVAYLVRDGMLLDRVVIGRRGGGLRRIRRILEDRYFGFRGGPSAAKETPVDVELIARWLAAHRDRVVAFDPTHLPNAEEVVARLRWFLDHGALDDPDGAPIVPR